jgi:hypothetical protein
VLSAVVIAFPNGFSGPSFTCETVRRENRECGCRAAVVARAPAGRPS